MQNSKPYAVRLITLALLLPLVLLPGRAQVKGAKDARAAVQTFFDLLRSQKYSALYDYLPREMQQRVTREQLTEGLKRLDGFLVIERMEIGRVQQRGDFAVVDTTIYGRLRRPMEINSQKVEEGKVAVQQYLFKEGTQWKVATADGNTRAYFLKRYPNFSKEFQFTQPQFFIKQNGSWKAVGSRQ
jgi:hypothetical protein